MKYLQMPFHFGKEEYQEQWKSKRLVQTKELLIRNEAKIIRGKTVNICWINFEFVHFSFDIFVLYLVRI